jgi:hypothetical protein
VGDEVGNVLEALLAQREQAVDVLLAAGGPQRVIPSSSHEAAVAVGLRLEKVMSVVSKRWRWREGKRRDTGLVTTPKNVHSPA